MLLYLKMDIVDELLELLGTTAAAENAGTD